MLIDLSVPINDSTPVYPGDPPTEIKSAGILERDGWCDHYLSIGTHVGTHIDAPMHVLENGKPLDAFALDQFVGKGRLIEITDGDFSLVKNASIQEGDIILFHTGLSSNFHDKSYFEAYPTMTEDIANFLVETKVKMVGFDTCSGDKAGDFTIHKILLAGNVLIIENLTNLHQLKDQDFIVYALPMSLQLDGAPARVIAELRKA